MSRFRNTNDDYFGLNREMFEKLFRGQPGFFQFFDGEPKHKKTTEKNIMTHNCGFKAIGENEFIYYIDTPGYKPNEIKAQFSPKDGFVVSGKNDERGEFKQSSGYDNYDMIDPSTISVSYEYGVVMFKYKHKQPKNDEDIISFEF